MSPHVDLGSRPSAAGLSPGTDPAALWVITAVVLAGLVVTSLAVVSRGRPVMAATAPASFAADELPLASPVRPAQISGLRLLHEAALACHSVPFSGVEVIDWWSPAGPSTSVMEVWHARGGENLVRMVAPGASRPPAEHRLDLPQDSGSPVLGGDGMLGMSQQLVALISANYQLAVSGWGEAAGRAAEVIVLHRRDGSLAARFWLDKATMLPLRRQTFDGQGQLAGESAFATLHLGSGAVRRIPGAAARPWGTTLATAQLARLRARGWPLPGPLPGNLTLLGARQDITPTGPVVDLDYSDGLSVISVFVQPGHLPAELTGWSQVAVRGQHVYADDTDGHSVAWNASGFVYTMIAAAPPQTVAEVVAALPHDGRPGLLARLGRGLHKLLAWVSP